MLVSLFVENIAIIKSQSLDFSNGFTILTGETGAGKSILIDAIGLILGGKSRKELIGPFAKHSFVKALFTNLPKEVTKILADNDISYSDDEIFLERKLCEDGRTISKINGVQVPLSLLQSIAPFLINIHGQHDHIRILNNTVHIEFLDRFAELDALLEQYALNYQLLRKARENLQSLQIKIQDREVRLNHLTFKLDEYEAVKPYVGLLSELQDRKKILQNRKAITDFVQVISSDNDHSLAPLVSSALIKASKLMDVNDRFKEIYNQLSEMQDLSSSILAESQDIISDFDNSESLSDIEDRIFALQQLLSRYGPTEEDLLKDWQSTKNEFEQTNSLDNSLQKAKDAYIEQLAIVQELAGTLSKKRKSAAKTLSQKVCDELKFLDMNGVSFIVDIQNHTNEKGGMVYNGRGFDKVEFLISTNVGQAPKPLQKIASGGELSRIMLSLTNVLNKQQVQTMIFDEVDAGVSGKTAEKIGVKLQQVSRDRQVICITHLAQIASLGDHHYKISKSQVDQATQTKVQLLDEKQRIDEISRIIGGINITDSIRNTAKEMLTNK